MRCVGLRLAEDRQSPLRREFFMPRIFRYSCGLMGAVHADFRGVALADHLAADIISLN